MDDIKAFEDLVAEEAQAEAGPSRPTDVAAVLSSVATKSPSWRFWSMFTATKTLAAAAVVALFAGLLLVSPLRPHEEAEIIPAQEIDPEVTSPVEFKARWLRAGDIDRGNVESHGDVVTYRDQRWNIMIEEPGDQRLDGEIDLYANTDQYSGLAVSQGYYRIETDEGAWQQRAAVLGLGLTLDQSPAGYTAVFDGEGAYEGLTAILSFTDYWETFDIKGVILEAPLPPAPMIGS